MADPVVGTAFVRIRALTAGVRRDIRRGFDQSVKQSERDVKKSGNKLGSTFTEGVSESLRRNSWTKIVSNHLKDVGKVESRERERAHTEALREDARRNRERLKALQDALKARARALDNAHAEALKIEQAHQRQVTKTQQDALKARTKAIDDAHAEALRIEQANQRQTTRAHQQGLAARAKALDDAHREALNENRRFERLLFRVRNEGRRARQRSLDQAHAQALQINQRMAQAGDRLIAQGKRIGRAFGQEIALEIRRLPILPFFLAAFAPAIAGVAKVLSAFAAEAVALLAPIGPALAASLSVAGQGATALAQGIGAAIALVKTAGPQLDEFNDRLELTKDRFRSVGQGIQSIALDPLIENIERATNSVMPRFRAEMLQTGRVLATTADRLGDLSEDPFFTARLGTILSSNNRVLDSLSRAGVALADSLVTILAAASPLTEQFADYAAATAEGWAESLRLAQATGELADWFRRAGEFLQQLGRIGENTRRALSETFSVSNRNARSLWDGIEGLTERWRDFAESTRGQDRMNQFFTQSRRITSEVTALFADMFRMIGDGVVSNSDALVSFIRTIRLRGLPAIADMSRAFAGLGPVFNDLVVVAADFLRVLTESGVVATFITTLRNLFVLISDLLTLPVVGQIAQWSLAFLAFGKALNLVTLGAFTRALRPLLGRLGQVGTAVALVGRQAVTAAGGAGLGAMRGSAGLLAGALGGPLGIAITGVTIGLGFLLKAHLDARQAAADHEAKMLEFADTLDRTTGALTTQSREWVANEIESRGFGDELERLGVASETFTQAALGNANALEEVQNAIDEDQLERASGLYDDMSGRLERAGISQSEFAAAVATGGDELEGMLNTLGPSGRVPALDNWRESVLETAGSHSELEGFVRETTAAIEEERRRLEEVADAAGVTSLEVQTLADSIGVLGDEFSSADEKARALDDALDVLSGGERDVEAANRRLHQSFRDVEDALVDTTASAEAGETVYLDLSSAIDDSSGKLNQSTEVGGIVADTYERLFDNAQSAALALAESGESASAVREPFDQMLSQFRGLLDTAGATPEEIDGIVNSLHDIPTETIVDLIMNSDQFDDPVAGAQQTLSDLNGAQAIAELVGDDIDLANKIVQNRDDLDDLDQTIAIATADLDDDEAQAVYDRVIALLANLNDQNPTPTADMDPRVLDAELLRIDRDLADLNAQEPTPEVRAEIGVFEARRRRVQQQLNNLNSDRADPTVALNDRATDPIIGIARRLNNLPTFRRVSVQVDVSTTGVSGTVGNLLSGRLAKGGVVSPGGRIKAAADGMLAQRVPMVAKGGSNIMWAEPETHAESYIPWAPAKRSRATRVLDRTASEFGFRLTPQADGGIVARTQSLLAQSSSGTASSLPASAPPVFQITVDGPEVQYRAEQIAQATFKQYRRDEAVRGRVPRG